MIFHKKGLNLHLFDIKLYYRNCRGFKLNIYEGFLRGKRTFRDIKANMAAPKIENDAPSDINGDIERTSSSHQQTAVYLQLSRQDGEDKDRRLEV